MIAEIISQFFVFYRYKELNLISSAMYRKYNSSVPQFLHNRPSGVVRHIMKRMSLGYPIEKIHQSGPKLFAVESELQTEKYQVWLGSDSYLPSCQCPDYKYNKLPCKHICAVVNIQGVGWESLGKSFKSHPLFMLDPVILNGIKNVKEQDTAETLPEIEVDSGEEMNHIESQESPNGDKTSIHQDLKTEKVCQLKNRKQMHRMSGRNKCVHLLKVLQDELYVVNTNNVFEKLEEKLKEAINYARQNRPMSNELPLKDVTCSPTKRAKRSTGIKKLKLRESKKRLSKFNKRVGIVAERRQQMVKIKGITPYKHEGKKVLTTKVAENNLMESRKRGILTELLGPINVDEIPDMAEENSLWVEINGIKLSRKLQDTLFDSNGWLFDEHIDAGQDLLKSLGNGIAGLNNTIAMAHCKLINVARENHQAIQCHNTGNHWVVSSSINGGNVVVYESMSTGLNRSLENQLLHMYGSLSKENGLLNVTVIVQQKQSGGSDCGLFCLANATALAHGIDPCTVLWNQEEMRPHLLECLQQKKMEMFPHNKATITHAQKLYHLSMFCTCNRHFDGATLIECSNCKKKYHLENPKCITVTAAQAAQIMTDNMFLCTKCL